MSVPVAMIPYANMAPYRQLGPPRGCHFVPLVPRGSIGALREGSVAAAAVPVGGLAQLDPLVETVGRFGIAAKGSCMSVLLFSHPPFEALHAPHTLRVTGETATSVRLLFLLLGRTLGFDRLPRLASDGEKPDAELLIGDRALLRGASVRGETHLHVTDLSEKWWEIHGLPFVFARWVVRKDAPASFKSAIARWLDEFRDQESLLVEQAIPGTARSLGVAPEWVQRYFRVIRRCLDNSDLAGQRQFQREFEKIGRRPLFQHA